MYKSIFVIAFILYLCVLAFAPDKRSPMERKLDSLLNQINRFFYK